MCFLLMERARAAMILVASVGTAQEYVIAHMTLHAMLGLAVVEAAHAPLDGQVQTAECLVLEEQRRHAAIMARATQPQSHAHAILDSQGRPARLPAQTRPVMDMAHVAMERTVPERALAPLHMFGPKQGAISDARAPNSDIVCSLPVCVFASAILPGRLAKTVLLASTVCIVI